MKEGKDELNKRNGKGPLPDPCCKMMRLTNVNRK